MIGLRGGFVSDWEYDQTFDHGASTFHLWKCQHREGYTAYQVTPQPAGGGYVKPEGTGHYTSWEALCRTHPMVIYRE